MKVLVVRGRAGIVDRLVIPLFQETRRFDARLGIDSDLLRMADRAVKEKVFKGGAGETLLLLPPAHGGVHSIVLLGLGPEKKCTLETLRRAVGSLSRRSRREGSSLVSLALGLPHLAEKLQALGWEAAVKAVTIAWVLGSYAFDTFKTEPARKKRPSGLFLRLPEGGPDGADRAVRAGNAEGEAVNFVRELVNRPANDLQPEKLAEEARRVARSGGLAFRLLRKRDLERLKMGALLGVAQGSDNPPCLMVLEYRAAKAPRGLKPPPTLALVGKAITFDCGGLSIKPAKGMEEMKYDMAGGGVVLGALKACAELKPPVNVVGIVPAAENAIGGSAMHPGDILRSASGKTIEVVNTDAEGRLILADALHYARRFRPDCILDFATLTGACLVALGTQVSGMVANNRELGRKVFEAGERSGERVWELPLYEEFIEATKSQVADLKNAAGRSGGAITAAAFLSHFAGSTPWCHLDIAGTAWAERDGGCFTAGATGVGVRLVMELIDGLSP